MLQILSEYLNTWDTTTSFPISCYRFSQNISTHEIQPRLQLHHATDSLRISQHMRYNHVFTNLMLQILSEYLNTWDTTTSSPISCYTDPFRTSRRMRFRHVISHLTQVSIWWLNTKVHRYISRTSKIIIAAWNIWFEHYFNCQGYSSWRHKHVRTDGNDFCPPRTKWPQGMIPFILLQDNVSNDILPGLLVSLNSLEVDVAGRAWRMQLSFLVWETIPSQSMTPLLRIQQIKWPALWSRALHDMPTIA
jgi:hypothetical protein